MENSFTLDNFTFTHPSIRHTVLKAFLALIAIGTTLWFCFLVLTFLEIPPTIFPMIVWPLLPSPFFAVVTPELRKSQRLILFLIPMLVALSLVLAIIVINILPLYTGFGATGSKESQEFFYYFLPDFGVVTSLVVIYIFLKFSWHKFDVFQAIKSDQPEPLLPICKVLGTAAFLTPFAFIFGLDVFGDLWIGSAVLFYAAAGSIFILLFDFGIAAPTRLMIWSASTTCAMLLYKRGLFDVYQQDMLQGNAYQHPGASQEFTSYFALMNVEFNFFASLGLAMTIISIMVLIRYRLARKKAFTRIRAIAKVERINGQAVIDKMAIDLLRTYPSKWAQRFSEYFHQLPKEEKKALRLKDDAKEPENP